MVCCKSHSQRIYLSHTLSSWGDRMFSFSIGLYLYNDSLQLTAIFGFVTCVSVILFGALIGKWIDRTQRIKVARISLAVQNLSVIICALLLIILNYYDDEVKKSAYHLESALLALIILFGVFGELGSVANKIAIQKDWIVVLANGNEEKLTKMNSTMRTIDLTTYILAPVVVGCVISYFSRIAGAFFIALWNVISGIVEFYLLNQIYKCVPELGKISNSNSATRTSGDGQNGQNVGNDQNQNVVQNSGENVQNDGIYVAQVKSTRCGSFGRWVNGTISGFSEYFHHPVKSAGIALAFLYMSVLCFDNVTTGYMYGQGISESVIGIMTALGAFMGILGSVMYPYLRAKVGKSNSGVVGFGVETFCLVSCLVAVFASGSPFDPNALFPSKTKDLEKNSTEMDRNSSTTTNSTKKIDFTQFDDLFSNHLSEVLLLLGMILSRFGLWVGDLSVSQIFQEEIIEEKRGTLNGVQDSLNQIMNLLKFVLVILFPSKETFGYLVFLSWLFVFFGLIFVSKYSVNEKRRRIREGLSPISPRRPRKNPSQKHNDQNNNNNNENGTVVGQIDKEGEEENQNLAKIIAHPEDNHLNDNQINTNTTTTNTNRVIQSDGDVVNVNVVQQ